MNKLWKISSITAAATAFVVVGFYLGLNWKDSFTTTPSQTGSANSSQETLPFLNNDKDIDTATAQLTFVVDALTSYAKPFTDITIKGEKAQTYGQPSTGSSSPYANDQRKVAQAALKCMMSELAKNPTNPALVLDVDETSLSNLWRILQEPNLATTTAIGTEARMTGQEPAIEATLDLYKEAIAKGVAVFFISGRTVAQRAVTEQNLKAVGFKGYRALITTEVGTEAIGTFKAGHRQKITEEGWTIITNMGDQFSDLNGEDGNPTELCSYKLPNPYYYLPWS